MRLHICAVGRIRSGPERALIDDYLSRFEKTGRTHGLGAIREHEVDERKADSQAAEGQALLRAVPEGASLLALDERGRQMSSPEFARFLAQMRDRGLRDMACLIGGADGLSTEVTGRAERMLSFGQMVWPHRLVRVMLAEQIYRAATIMAGSPYHRA
ncbi:MAG: 23S rRNA (pseudouridine(1915)-N(3))-methyltransferase RlmH [Rhodobacteraceae bacterium]|nr:MAG: 23S rRNA (pseudouridine(1915)-N(3))-methyltransferase RlmH [Paracoccaceae bacterium]